MGWNIDIETDKPITESVVETIISELPDSLSRGFSRQEWGWSLAVDVCLQNPQKLGLSGSYTISGEIAEYAAESFARRLEKRGFKVICSDMS